MTNEVLYILIALVEFILIFGLSRLGRGWVLMSIGVNMILISLLGRELISLFGMVSNIGNVFYASVFLAMYFLVERYGPNSAYRALWIGFSMVAMFVIISQLATFLVPFSESENIAVTIRALLDFGPRVALGSIVAYLVAGHFNIWLYQLLRGRFHDRHLWLRTLLVLIPAQLLDSVLFFTIVFYQPDSVLLEAITAGWLIKVAIGVLGVPFLYLHRVLKPRPVFSDDMPATGVSTLF